MQERYAPGTPEGPEAGLLWVEEPRPAWWVRVERADGRTGWLWMDRTAPVRGADACAG